MGLLLMSYEYQRAKQKCNMLELKSIRLNDMQERYQKRIANIEKLFSKKKTSLESQYTNLQHNLSAQLSTMTATGSFTSVGSIFTTLVGSTAAKALQAAAGEDLQVLEAAGVKPTEDGTKTATATSALNQQLSQRTAIVAQLQATLQTVIQQ